MAMIAAEHAVRRAAYLKKRIDCCYRKTLEGLLAIALSTRQFGGSLNFNTSKFPTRRVVGVSGSTGSAICGFSVWLVAWLNKALITCNGQWVMSSAVKSINLGEQLFVKRSSLRLQQQEHGCNYERDTIGSTKPVVTRFNCDGVHSDGSHSTT